MTYFFIAIVCTLISAKLFSKASGSISIYRPNMMAVVFYFYLVLENVVGAVLVVNHLDDHYILNKMSNDIYRYYGFWTIMYTLVAFPIGQMIANSLWGWRRMDVVYLQYLSRPLVDEPRFPKTIKKMFIALSILSMLAVFYTLSEIGGSPLSRIFGGLDALAIATMRSEASRGFLGNQYIRNIFGLQLTPFLSYIAYAYYRLTRTSVNRFWFMAMVVCSVLILTYDLSKSPILWYILSFLFFWVYEGNAIPKRVLFIVGGIMVLLVVAIYILLMQVDLDSLLLFNQGIIGRLTLSSSAGVFVTFDVFDTHNHLGFSSFSQFLSQCIGVPYSERSARIIMEQFNPSGIAAGVAGVMNALFVAEGYANWGMMGLLLSPLYVGFIIQVFYLFFLSKPKTPFFMSLMVTYTISSAINGGVNDYIYNPTTVIMMVLYFFIYKLVCVPKKYEKNYHSLSVQDP